MMKSIAPAVGKDNHVAKRRLMDWLETLKKTIDEASRLVASPEPTPQ
jgi:hypothetical protein